jgi:hypothetical protein
MKTRALWYSLFVGVVSMTSGCCCARECFPNVGWRLHPGASCSPCAPACSSCAPGPAFRPPMVVSGGPIVPGGPDCPGCAGGGGGSYPLPAGYQPGYPPVIGRPMPIPGATIVPGTELHQPMPVKPGN